MARGSSSSSLPPGTETRLRRLSSGSVSSERPLRAQVILTCALGFILLAVPTYFLRRPSGAPEVEPPSAAASRFGGVVLAEPDAAAPVTQVMVGPIQRVRCGTSAAQATEERGACDALPALEAAFRRSVETSAEDCAPRTGNEGSINYVLEVDFASTRLNIFPGQSGKWHGPQARRAAACVLRSFPDVPWTGIAHQHDYYAIALLATYPAPDPLEVLPTFD